MNQILNRVLKSSILLSLCFLMFSSCSKIIPSEEDCDGYILVRQNGPTLSYSPNSGVKILYEGKFQAFKDLNKNGMVDEYEDWRLSPEQRAHDLANRMRLEEIAGLMLYSDHQAIPNSNGWTPATWGGKPYSESGAQPWELSDQQKKFMEKDNVRHILITSVKSAEVAARWNNEAQAFVEKLRLGIPTNNSSDPRHSPQNDVEYRAGGGGDISLWPNELGMGATFDPKLMYLFGEIASAEYRALGFTTSLSPQIDIATDPRWSRFDGTYGEDPELVKDMAIAYCDAFQTTTWYDHNYGAWGPGSVNVMVKHWPGGGPGEAGRDAHFGRGKYAVYPNDNLELQKYPFVEGAFKLQKGTGMAAAVMPYYTIPFNQTSINVANNFNKDILLNQLRSQAGFEGVVCTDWGVTADEFHPGIHSGKPWGVEEFSIAERHYMAILAGVDQFGGNNDAAPVLEAFNLIKNMYGNGTLMERLHRSAERLLINMFRVGLFENPYLDPAQSAKEVGKPEYMKAGYDAQLKSIVMLKNKAKALPVSDKKALKVYIPNRHLPKRTGFFGGYSKEETFAPVAQKLVNQYFRQVNNPEQADIAIVFIDSPMSGWGYKASETLADPTYLAKTLKAMSSQYPQLKDMTEIPLERILQEDDIYFKPTGTNIPEPDNGYYPISLQYSDYVAVDAREQSIAGGDQFEHSLNRSYKGKGVRCINKDDMLLVQETRAKMQDKKVIVVVNCKNPFVMSEIEPYADAILLTFGVQHQAIFDIISGKREPSALLPFQMPANMKTVELQAEDTPHDMECYIDELGNIYDFAFGLGWNGVIEDERVLKYKK